MRKRTWISPQKKVYVPTRNFTNRLIHWIIFFSVITLMVTGYYIGEPTYVYGYGEAYQEFTMADMRLYHFYAATTLNVSLLVWLYLAFFSGHHRYWRELLPTPRSLRGAWLVFKCYFTFEKPPFYRYSDPFDGLLFLVLVILMALQMLTGFQMYANALSPDYFWSRILHATTDWLVPCFGGVQNVRTFHHFTEWLMLAGIVAHVYLQVSKTIIFRDGHIGQIVGGYKYKDTK